MDVINMKEGSAMASKAPDKMRSAAREAKFLDAAWHMSRTHHMKMLPAK
jgi:hypothetical protein